MNYGVLILLLGLAVLVVSISGVLGIQQNIGYDLVGVFLVVAGLIVIIGPDVIAKVIGLAVV